MSVSSRRALLIFVFCCFSVCFLAAFLLSVVIFQIRCCCSSTHFWSLRTSGLKKFGVHHVSKLENYFAYSSYILRFKWEKVMYSRDNTLVFTYYYYCACIIHSDMHTRDEHGMSNLHATVRWQHAISQKPNVLYTFTWYKAFTQYQVPPNKSVFHFVAFLLVLFFFFGIFLSVYFFPLFIKRQVFHLVQKSHTRYHLSQTGPLMNTMHLSCHLVLGVHMLVRPTAAIRAALDFRCSVCATRRSNWKQFI